MQMYRGLPIITNQIPEAERNGIPHHLISCIGLEKEAWRVGIFRRECLRLIRDIQARGKLPILVGGTHYYTQAVLFKDQLVGESNDDDADGSGDDRSDSEPPVERWPILNAPTEIVLQKLREVDPVMANRWHPNESRKIRRSLEIYLQKGKPASEIYEEQKLQKQAASAGQLRFPTLIFWIHADRSILNTRLDARVDKMFEQGLVTEAKKMTTYLHEMQSQGIPVDETKGVWVSIGFKELGPYITALNEASSSDENQLESLRQACAESVKTATRQYAASQLKWIRNKLWKAMSEANVTHRFFVLDSSNVEEWESRITEPSERLVHVFLNEESLPDPKSLSELARTTLVAREAQAQHDTNGLPKCVTCEVCNKTMVNEEQWKVHMNGQSHKKAVRGAQRRAERDEFLRKQEAQNAENSLNEG